MRHHHAPRTLLTVLVTVLSLTMALAFGASADAANRSLPATRSPRAACATAAAHHVRCLVTYRTPPAGQVVNLPQVIRTLGPRDIASAYGLSGGRNGETVAIVGAFGYPSLERDLAAYRAHWGLPACTRASGCLRIVNSSGRTSPAPSPDPGWALEQALDVQAVSAACPACKILVVQAFSDDIDEVGSAVNTAVRLKAQVVSNSYGGDEFNGIASVASTYYHHPGVPIVASAGDTGFGPAEFPASSPTVISVGGTTLSRSVRTTRGWTESAWQGGGSGCSAWFAKPSYQSRALNHCLMRTSTDVSAVGDPYSNFAVYDSFQTPNNWLLVGGTSLAAPLVAGMIARAGHSTSYGTSAARLYQHRSSFNDITSGTNGYCGGDYLCTAKKGYDAPTGLGSPRGLGGL